ncbi:E3 ubiquitin-protein ligase TRIM11-like [Bufo gargarizans]|uniref:E3 ubiquitin-protein ligase TRIM11-like n=1 Tax=Bufo gargarizans TaxID=30331 RepID=UPI001CF10754|nr:E3 ubiquitin-protein ligase TRIM11-like [Bufo gargarizans]
MASAELRDELNCSICLSLYTDPVSLRCGHNFCRSCIVSVLDAQEAGGVYSCPDCRVEYPERPALEKNRKLSNIVERFLSTQPDMEKTRTFCSYCTKSPVPAVKSCLQCENSLCDDHLTVHNQTMDHVLSEPTSSFGKKKCSIHKKVLEYYCLQDATCLCVSCCLFGKHRGHQVEHLVEASEKKKKKLRKYLDELNPQKAKNQAKIQSLYNDKGKIQKRVSEKRKNINTLFMNIREQLDIAERKVLSEISRQEMKMVSQIDDLMKKMEIKEDELFRKMRHMEEMCRITDPIRLLQESGITVCSHADDEDTGGDGGQMNSEEVGLVPGQAKVQVSDSKVQNNETDIKTVLQESDQRTSLSNKRVVTEEAAVRDNEVADDLEDVQISSILHRSLKDVITYVTSKFGIHVPDILLDVDTAHTYIGLSEDLRTASDLDINQERPESPGRFQTYCQVLSRCSFSSGRHYWEVEWNQIGDCGIGMSYPSIERNGDQSAITQNDKSWCLFLSEEKHLAFDNSVKIILDVNPTCPTVGVFLDYEAGRLSFYELCDPIRHLHTFRASFTEPLHVILYVDGASVKIRS